MISLEQALSDLAVSTWRVLIGFLMAFAIALILAIARHHLPRRVRSHVLVKLCFDLPKFPPPIAWIPFVVLWLGIGQWAAITIVIIGALPALFTHMYDGLENFSPRQLQLADSLEIHGLKRYYFIYAKAMLPYIFTGSKMAMSMAWMSVIASEMVSGESGLGYGIQMSRVYLDYDMMVLYMFLIGLMGFVFYQGIELGRVRWVKWPS